MLSKSLKQVDMADVAGCSDRAIRAMASNPRCFGKTRAPANGVGRRRRMTPQMFDALRERLLEKAGLYQDEMALFLYNEFNVLLSTSCISRALASIGWSKKAGRELYRGETSQCA